MNYRTAFPDFPPADMPELPRDFADTSWRQDACPSMSNTKGLVIWIDYVDPGQREHPEGGRFTISGTDSNGKYSYVESDNWQDILDFIEGSTAR